MDIASYSVAEIKRITDADEIKKILPVISSAWGMPDLSAALKDTINAMRFHGGLVLAAYSGPNEEVQGTQYGEGSNGDASLGLSFKSKRDTIA